MGGAAQRVAEAEPMHAQHAWQQGNLADHAGRPKVVEGPWGTYNIFRGAEGESEHGPPGGEAPSVLGRAIVGCKEG